MCSCAELSVVFETYMDVSQVCFSNRNLKPNKQLKQTRAEKLENVFEIAFHCSHFVVIETILSDWRAKRWRAAALF